MITIVGLITKKINNISSDYNLLINEEILQTNKLKESFKEIFNLKLEKIILDMDNSSLLRYQINDEELFNLIISKKSVELHCVLIEDIESVEDKIELTLKEGLLSIKGQRFNNQLLNEKEKQKIINSIYNKIKEIDNFIDQYNSLFVSIIKRYSFTELFSNDIYKFKDTLLNNFKQSKNTLNSDFEIFISELKKEKYISLYFLTYNIQNTRRLNLNVMRISYQKTGFYYNAVKISKNELYLFYKNSFCINNKNVYNLSLGEINDLINYLNNKNFLEELKLIQQLENF